MIQEGSDQRRRILQVASDTVGDVARQLCKGTATPAKVSKAAKKLTCLARIQSISAATPAALVAGMDLSLASAWRQVLVVKTQLTPLCTHLVGIVRWLVLPEARALWQGEQRGALMDMVAACVKLLAQLLKVYEIAPGDLQRSADAATDATVATVVTAGWLDILGDLIAVQVGIGRQTFDATCASTLAEVAISLRHICASFAGHLAEDQSDGIFYATTLDRLQTLGVVEQLSAAVLALHDDSVVAPKGVKGMQSAATRSRGGSASSNHAANGPSGRTTAAASGAGPHNPSLVASIPTPLEACRVAAECTYDVILGLSLMVCTLQRKGKASGVTSARMVGRTQMAVSLAAPPPAADEAASTSAAAAAAAAASAVSTAPTASTASMLAEDASRMIIETCTTMVQGTSVRQLTIDVTAARLAECRLPAADAPPPRFSCAWPRRLAGCHKDMVPSTLEEVCSHLAMVLHVQKSVVAEDQDGRDMTAGSVLLLLEALLLMQSARQPIREPDHDASGRQQWCLLRILMRRLDEAQVTTFCEVAGPCFVAHVAKQCAVAANSPAPLVGKIAEDLEVLLCTLLLVFKPTASATGSRAKGKLYHPTMAAVRALALGSDGQLLTALEQLLRRHPNFSNAGDVGSVLFQVLGFGSLLMEIFANELLLNAVTGLVITYGKWLLLKATQNSWTDAQWREQQLQEMLEQLDGYDEQTCRSEAMSCCKAAAMVAALMAQAPQLARVHEGSEASSSNGSGDGGSSGNGGSSGGDGGSSNVPQTNTRVQWSIEDKRRLLDLAILVLCRVGAPAARLLNTLLPDAKLAAEGARASLHLHTALTSMLTYPVFCAAVEDAIVASGGAVPVPLPQLQTHEEGPFMAAQGFERQLPWWDALLALPLPAHLPLGCHNPTCTNLKGTVEAALRTKLCKGCSTARFCSTQCQAEAWPRHKHACRRAAAAQTSQQPDV